MLVQSRSMHVAAVLALLAAATANSALAQPAAVEPPATAVGAQVAWLLDVSSRLPISEVEADEHFSPEYLAAVPLAEINAVLAAVAGPTGWTLLRYEGHDTTARILVQGAAVFLVFVGLDPEGRIGALFGDIYFPAPATWEELDDRLAALAPRTSLLAARITNGRCELAHGVSPRQVMPLASSFKLYVLGALAHEVQRGAAMWDEPLAIRDDWKSLGSGVFQTFAPGTLLSLREYANAMISISDNTATDHLMGRLGRVRVEAQQLRFRMTDPQRNAPFLTTRELFTLKLTDYPRMATIFEGLPSPLQRLYLAGLVDKLPLPLIESVESWTTPRSINTIEWFASPADVCRAFAGLDRQAATPGLEPVGDALSLEDGALLLDPDTWRQTWFKGGSELGVLTLNYLARTSDQTYVVSAMVSDPSAALPQNAQQELKALIRGAFALAAGVPTAADIPSAGLPGTHSLHGPSRVPFPFK